MNTNFSFQWPTASRTGAFDPLQIRKLPPLQQRAATLLQGRGTGAGSQFQQFMQRNMGGGRTAYQQPQQMAQQPPQMAPQFSFPSSQSNLLRNGRLSQQAMGAGVMPPSQFVATQAAGGAPAAAPAAGGFPMPAGGLTPPAGQWFGPGGFIGRQGGPAPPTSGAIPYNSPNFLDWLRQQRQQQQQAPGIPKVLY